MVPLNQSKVIVRTTEAKTKFKIISHSQRYQPGTPIFITNANPQLAKNQVKAEQHTDADLLLFENYSLS